MKKANSHSVGAKRRLSTVTGVSEVLENMSSKERHAVQRLVATHDRQRVVALMFRAAESQCKADTIASLVVSDDSKLVL